jgi:putative membrane protein
MNLLAYLIINGFAVFIAAYILPGVVVDTFWTAVLVAVVLGVVNVFIKPFITLLTLPFTILTFGLFIFIINAALVLFVDFLVNGFEVQGFMWALIFSLVISLVSSFLSSLTKS